MCKLRITPLISFLTSFLCNTSGSGKTRILFEGLWCNWGLYFTACTKPDGVGSTDIEEIFKSLKEGNRLEPLTPSNMKDALAENRKVTSRHFLLVLYVRLLVFGIFLECASRVPGGIKDEHKSLWLLIQLAPQEHLKMADVFNTITQSLIPATLDYLKLRAHNELLKVRRYLGPEPPPLFCILDEAQVPSEMFSDCFPSDTEPRPILRQIIDQWVPIFSNLIVSGAGLSLQELETVLGSVVAKETGRQPETVTDLGAFDNEEDQRAYLEQYLPPGFLDTDSGNQLARRLGYWLHGRCAQTHCPDNGWSSTCRHRFIVTYVSCLICGGFESPHGVLNEFVHDMTNIWPSDWDPSSVDEPATRNQSMPKLGKIHGFNFPKLKQGMDIPYF